MKDLARILLLVTTLLMATACSSNAPAPPTFFFPQQKEIPNAYMNALLTGELVLVGDCLRIDDSEDNSYLPIWPKGFSMRTEGDAIWVIDAAGEAIVQVGDRVRVSGGEMPAVARFLAEPLPESCTGPYWLVGSEVGK